MENTQAYSPDRKRNDEKFEGKYTKESYLTVGEKMVYVSDLKSNSLVAFDRKTMKEVWRVKIENDVPLTPVLKNGVIYLLTKGGICAIRYKK